VSSDAAARRGRPQVPALLYGGAAAAAVACSAARATVPVRSASAAVLQIED